MPKDSVPAVSPLRTSTLFFQEMMRSSPDRVSTGFSNVSAMVPAALTLPNPSHTWGYRPFGTTSSNQSLPVTSAWL